MKSFEEDIGVISFNKQDSAHSKPAALEESPPEIKLTTEEKHTLSEDMPFHPLLYPFNPKRFIISGPTSSGKTYALLKILPLFGEITNLFLFCSSGFDDLVYKKIIDHFGENIQLRKSLEDVDEVFEARDGENSKKNIVVVIDDFHSKKMLENSSITNLFCTGRHRNISVILIIQNLFDVPPIIRRNANNYIIFRTPSPSIIHKDVQDVLPLDMFKKIMSSLPVYNFVWINKDISDDEISFMRIRRNTDEISMRKLDF